MAVGDYVTLEPQKDGTCWITNIEERKNYIIRRSTNLSKQAHILAANIDTLLLVVTVNHPTTSTTFIDRILATAEAYSVPSVILFNKIDLLTTEEQNRLSELRMIYERLGYTTIAFSALHDPISTLLPLLQDKVTLLSGNSGVGKSTLLNALFGKEMTRTRDISETHNKGMHTTTFSEMYPLPQGGWLIDTPGVKGFGSIDIHKEEVGHFFREIFRQSQHCRYSNCLHLNETGCAVLPEVGQSIAPSRFDSYLSMLGDEEENKYRQ